MEILLTRHGQTEWNLLKKVQGKADIYECLINISTNDFENDATNVILKINLPEEMEYKSVAYEGGTTPNKVVVKE